MDKYEEAQHKRLKQLVRLSRCNAVLLRYTKDYLEDSYYCLFLTIVNSEVNIRDPDSDVTTQEKKIFRGLKIIKSILQNFIAHLYDCLEHTPQLKEVLSLFKRYYARIDDAIASGMYSSQEVKFTINLLAEHAEYFYRFPLSGLIGHCVMGRDIDNIDWLYDGKCEWWKKQRGG